MRLCGPKSSALYGLGTLNFQLPVSIQSINRKIMKLIRVKLNIHKNQISKRRSEKSIFDQWLVEICIIGIRWHRNSTNHDQWCYQVNVIKLYVSARKTPVAISGGCSWTQIIVSIMTLSLYTYSVLRHFTIITYL